MSPESGIVGALLLDARYLDEVLDIVRPEQFREPQARKAMLAIIQIAAEGLTPDVVTVAERTRAAGVDSVWLIKAMEEVGSATNAPQYARELARTSLVSQFRALAHGVMSKAKPGADPGELAQELEAGLEALSAGQERQRDTAAEAVVERYFRRIADFREKRLKLLPCHTVGLTDADPNKSIIPYWFGGLSLVISAYTTSGKSAYAINLALAEACAGANVAIFTNEMGEYSYTERAAGYFADIPYGQIRHHLLNNLEREKINGALLQFSSLPIHVIDNAYTVEFITRRIRRMQYTFKPDIVIVDYLQNLTKRPGEERYESLSRQSKELIGLAKKYEFSLVMLSQIDNASAREQDPERNIMSVKGSGDVAADADIFMELIRNSMNVAKEHQIKRIIRKNREYGRTGIAELWFNRSFTRILAEPEQDFSQANYNY